MAVAFNARPIELANAAQKYPLVAGSLNTGVDDGRD